VTGTRLLEWEPWVVLRNEFCFKKNWKFFVGQYDCFDYIYFTHLLGKIYKNIQGLWDKLVRRIEKKKKSMWPMKLLEWGLRIVLWNQISFYSGWVGDFFSYGTLWLFWLVHIFAHIFRKNTQLYSVCGIDLCIKLKKKKPMWPMRLEPWIVLRNENFYLKKFVLWNVMILLVFDKVLLLQSA
jgi:hypothetical protein